MRRLRVAVAGGGLGGLCLAQGLHKAGADVTVYERDAALASRRQGYRLHVDARAGLALQRCPPPDLFELFLAACGRPGTRFTVMSERLRVLREVAGDPGRDPAAPATLSTSVNRQTLREVLAAGLGRQIVFGREFTRYEARGGWRRHPRDEPGPRLRREHRAAKRGAAVPHADRCRSGRLRARRLALTAAIGAYETRMREYGYAAIHASREAEANMGARRGSLMYPLPFPMPGHSVRDERVANEGAGSDGVSHPATHAAARMGGR